ncbi:MAG: PhoH family protein [Rikenellaceae bacterium]
MSEKEKHKATELFDLAEIDLLSFYGERNSNINYISSKFQDLKITSRGNKVKVNGEENVLERFKEGFVQLIAYFLRYGHISKYVIDQTFDAPELNRIQTINPSINKQEGEDNDIIVYGNNGNIIRARTENQRKMVELFSKNDLMFAIGPAGSGKTYTAIALAVRALKNRQVKKIILTRPAVEAGEKLGFLPGDMKEKLDPYLQPLYDALHDMMPQKKLAEYMEQWVIQIAPLAYMRGRTLDEAFVILDEAQNSTSSQLKMFLTRMGRNSKFIVTGDVTQIDLPKKSDSGLTNTIKILEGIDSIAVIEMKSEDIVRHKLVKDIVAAFGNA